jgi:hypothetical protein
MAKHRINRTAKLAQNVKETTPEKLARKTKRQPQRRKKLYISKADRAKAETVKTAKPKTTNLPSTPTTSPKTINRKIKSYQAKQRKLQRAKQKLYKSVKKKNRKLARQLRQQEKAERRAKRESKRIATSVKPNMGRSITVTPSTPPPSIYTQPQEYTPSETTWEYTERDEDNRTAETPTFDDANDFLSSLYQIVLEIAERSTFVFAYRNYRVILGIAEKVNDILGYPYEAKAKIADEIANSSDYQRIYEILNMVDYEEFESATDDLALTISSIADRYF